MVRPWKLTVKVCRGVVLFASAICVVASAHSQAPLPDDISISPPSPAIAQHVSAFSGAWLGAWGAELPTALVVEQVNSNGTAEVIYSWGDSPTHQFEAGWSRHAGRISKGKLRFLSDGGASIDFTLEPGGVMTGRYKMINQPPSFAELHRVTTTNVSDILKAAKKRTVAWEEIRIPVQSQVGPTKGKTFGLQTTIYRQAGSGKHPVVIFNHGSTGPGIVPPKQVFRGGNEESFFHSLGYVVVMPMRKGRGLSDGPNLEEDFSLSSSTQLDSAIEDLHAIVEHVRRQNDANPGKIIVAGVSRGGLLSVDYAARYPTNVAGVINFSGGWFGEGMPAADFNFEMSGKSGHEAKVPMLWLYADHDSFYSLKFVEGMFSKFREAGGRGELVEMRDIPGEGHLLCLWVDHWGDKVKEYLKGL